MERKEQQNTTLSSATQAAIAQLSYELNHLCDYKHILAIENQPAAVYVRVARIEISQTLSRKVGRIMDGDPYSWAALNPGHPAF